MSDSPIFDRTERENVVFNSPEYIELADRLDAMQASSVSAKPQPKVVAATVGAGVGSALATVVSWIITISSGVEIPEAVELSIGVILTAGLAFVGGYWKKN